MLNNVIIHVYRLVIIGFSLITAFIHDFLLFLCLPLSGKSRSWSAEDEPWQQDFAQLQAGLEEWRGNFSIRLIVSNLPIINIKEKMDFVK